MTLLRSAPRSTDSTSGGAPVTLRLRAVLAAMFAAVLAVVVSWLVMALPVVLAWFVDTNSSVTLTQTLGVSVDIWAMAHRGAVEAGGVQIVFAPLVLTLIPLLACRYAVGQVMVDRQDRGVTGKVSRAGAAWRALGGAELTTFFLAYVTAGALLSSLAGLGQAPVLVASVLPGLLLIPLIAICLALASEHRRQTNPVIVRGLDWVHARIPVLLRRGVRPAMESLGLLLVVGLVIVIGVVVMQGERILTLHQALDAGIVGTSVLTAAQLAALPNLAVWAVAWTGGAGVQVGTAEVTWAQSTTGDLPLIPILASLPEPGPMPPLLWLSAAVPVLLGCWLGWRVVAGAPRLATWWTKTQIALAGTAMLMLGFLVLAWLSSGGMTPGRLGLVGVPALQATGLLGAWVLAGALLSLTLLHLTRRRM